jgi:hypothetical protein
MRTIKIAKKAIFDISHYDDRHIKRSDWENPPNFSNLKKAKDVFKTKKHINYQKLYTLLIARSNELKGDTKVSNENVAKILKISVRQVIRCFQFLEKHRLISSIKKCYNFNGKYKTVRIIRVWLTYYKHKCRPTYEKVFKNDIRPGKEKDEQISRKIPLKFRVWGNFVPKAPCKFKKEFVPMKKMDYSWLNLTKQGYINNDMNIAINQIETIASDVNMRKNIYSIVGYNKDFLIYKNTGIKKSDKYKKNFSVKEETKFLKQKFEHWRENGPISN